MTQSRTKLFLENILFYGGTKIIVQIIPFIMLPLISRLLTIEVYGVVDLFNIAIFFGVQFVGLGIWDAMFREFFEKKNDEEYKIKVTSTALMIVIFSGIFFGIITLIFENFLSTTIFGDYKYKYLIFIGVITINITALKSIYEAPTRMRNNKKIFLIIGILTPILNYTFILIFIKLKYTYEAMIYSNLILNSILLIFFMRINYKDFNIKKIDLKISLELLKIGIPILPMALMYWTFNSFDRAMIAKMLNYDELGIYSIGSKVASVSHLISAAFAGGWSYFAFSTMKDKDQMQLNSKIFEYLGVISIFLFLCSLPFIQLVFNYFFTGNYTRGAEVFPYLFLAPLFLMMNQIIATQTLVIKKSYISMLTLFVGTILNIILNYFFIKQYGIKGAALATLISYFASVIITLIINIKYGLNRVTLRFILVVIVAWITILLIFYNNNIYIFTAIINFFSIILFYRKDLLNCIKIKKGVVEKNGKS